jgi:hypothetical protein
LALHEVIFVDLDGDLSFSILSFNSFIISSFNLIGEPIGKSCIIAAGYKEFTSASIR